MVLLALLTPHRRFSLSQMKSRSGIFRSIFMVPASVQATNAFAENVSLSPSTALMTRSLLFSFFVVQPEIVTPSPAENLEESPAPVIVMLSVVTTAFAFSALAPSSCSVEVFRSRYFLSGQITSFVLTTANCFSPAVTVPTTLPS